MFITTTLIAACFSFASCGKQPVIIIQDRPNVGPSTEYVPTMRSIPGDNDNVIFDFANGTSETVQITIALSRRTDGSIIPGRAGGFALVLPPAYATQVLSNGALDGLGYNDDMSQSLGRGWIAKGVRVFDALGNLVRINVSLKKVSGSWSINPTEWKQIRDFHPGWHRMRSFIYNPNDPTGMSGEIY